MIIRLKELIQGPRHVNLRFDPNWWGKGDPNHQVLGLAGPLEVHLTLARDGSHYAVNGKLFGDVWLRCDRCAEAYQYKVQSEFALVLTSMLPDPVSGEIALSEEDMAVEFLTDEVIEIDHLVREQLYLSLPVKLLCHEGCKGLCPGCGANLNCETCSCSGKSGRLVFLKLKELTINKDSDAS